VARPLPQSRPGEQAPGPSPAPAYSESPTARQAFQLALPVACELGKSCVIHAYVDIDPEPLKARDWACGAATFDGHTGTDFRLPRAEDAAKGVAVLAAAPGVVKEAYDGMRDVLARPRRPALIAGPACGNSVTIDHGQGWETQYCHLRQGSVLARPGAPLKTGDKLGDVGYSGNASSAHLHFMVRYAGNIVDPFLPLGPDGSCLSASIGEPTLWSPEASRAMGYAGGRLLEIGLSETPPRPLRLMQGSGRVTKPTGQSPEIYVYARLVHARAGDRVRFVLTGPGEVQVESLTEPLTRDQALHTAQAGHRRRGWSWRLGTYGLEAELIRGGKVVGQAKLDVELR
jgi:murein DD-endopeptidase MepM/ murein hydrolase activator NlpD